MARIDEADSLKWNVPYDREKPIIYVKDCRLDIPDSEHYKDVYGLTTDLTDLEKTSKYARYYYLGQAMPDAESLKAVEIGRSIDPAEAFLVEDYARKMDVAGGAALKTGYCVMSSGIGFATTTVRGKGITAEVMSYFLDNFNPPEDLYYKAWCPGAHIRHYDGAAIEDLGYGMSMLRFTEGLTAEKIGLPTPAEHDQYCIGLTGANFRCTPLHDPEGEPLYVAELCYYRQLEDSYEERVTFWPGAQFIDGKTVPYLTNGQPVNPMIPMLLARHSLWETTTLFRNIITFWNDNH